MQNQDLTITHLVDQSPEEVFAAINNVRGWWSEGVEGGTEKLHDEFSYRHKDIHFSRQRLIEVVPNKKVVWLVTESDLSFLTEKNEWAGTKVVFEVAKQGDKTQLTFTHLGLVPEVECYDACSGGWRYYISGSLLKLITTGEGQPDQVEENEKLKA